MGLWLNGRASDSSFALDQSDTIGCTDNRIYPKVGGSNPSGPISFLFLFADYGSTRRTVLEYCNTCTVYSLRLMIIMAILEEVFNTQCKHVYITQVLLPVWPTYFKFFNKIIEYTCTRVLSTACE